MQVSRQQLIEMLQAFSMREDVSQDLAGQIEVSISKLFLEDERFDDFLLALASYRPGGGLFLYDTDEIASMCVTVMSIIQSDNATAKE